MQKREKSGNKGYGIQLIESVKNGITDRAAAITIIEEIYGVSNDIANSMLGST